MCAVTSYCGDSVEHGDLSRAFSLPQMKTLAQKKAAGSKPDIWRVSITYLCITG
jgi:hypothetical protein